MLRCAVVSGCFFVADLAVLGGPWGGRGGTDEARFLGGSYVTMFSREVQNECGVRETTILTIHLGHKIRDKIIRNDVTNF